MTDAERLKYLIEKLMLTPNSFAREIGATPDTLYNILKKGAPITTRLAKRIIDTYPNINIDWLLKGEGELFVWQKIETTDEPIRKYEKNAKYVRRKKEL